MRGFDTDSDAIPTGLDMDSDAIPTGLDMDSDAIPTGLDMDSDAIIIYPNPWRAAERASCRSAGYH
jgi:hypothetical protein